MNNTNNSGSNSEIIIERTGIIIPVEWDDNGFPTAVAISTYNEEEYRIDEGNDIGKELKYLKTEKIKIIGAVKEGPTKHKVVTVLDYIRL